MIATPPDGWFRRHAEAGGVVFFVVGSRPDVAVEFVSENSLEQLGYRASDLISEPELLRRMVAAGHRQQFEEILATPAGESARLEVEWVRPDGSAVWTDNVFSSIAREDGSVALEGTCHVITALREAERQLAASEELYRLLTENAYDVIWTMALDGTITYVSPSVERVRGITPKEAASQTLDQIHPEDSALRVMEYYGRLYAAIQDGSELPTFHGVQEYYRNDGSIMTGELQVVPQVDADGRVVQILGVTRDISDRAAVEVELNRLAVTDALTGAWNRRHGERLFEADLLDAHATGRTMALLTMDVDNFKVVNDTLGHQAGDKVLIELTRRIVDALNPQDTLVRWGGDEFAIALRDCSQADATRRAESLRSLIVDTPFGDLGTVSVSIGVAELRADDDLNSWLHRADQAMYEAKRAGRNAVRAGTTG